ncbi:MAG TPA: ABC transporter permease, partial [Candidatus Acidoferrales bacterium]|nr:ABC transporter permease [Candidatus Acidoferrales bacterium]
LAEARRLARLSLGGAEQIKQSVADHRGLPFLDSLWQDVRYGARMLRKTPGFTLVAVLTLALGIGANTAIFSVVYAALLRPLPYAQPNRLITLDEVRPQEELSSSLNSLFWNVSYPDYLDWVRQSKSFDAIAGFTLDQFVLRGSGDPRPLFAAQASTNFFSILGVRLALGRDFAHGEDISAGPKVAILTYAFWQSRFGGDRNVIGRTLQLDTNSVTIIGVLPRDFEFGPARNAEIWVPFHMSSDFLTRRNLRWMPAIARLAPGASFMQARSEMNAITARLAAAYPQQNAAIQVVMVPLRDRIVGRVQPLLLILFGAVAFVLLIACANVANLMMVRATGRRKEFTIRAALGAGRSRLIAQLLAESLLLAVAGGAFGLLFADWGTAALIAAIPSALLDSMPFLRDAHANSAILAFLCAISLITGMAFGLAPALQISTAGFGDALKDETRMSAGKARTRLRDALVIAETAFCLVLLAGAGLMMRSLNSLLHQSAGFDTANLLTFSVSLPDNSYPKDADALRFDREFTTHVLQIPGVAGIASNSTVPLTGGGGTVRFVLEGQVVATGHESECNIRDVSASYFPVMKIRLLSGRTFDDMLDSATSPPRAIVNRTWVDRYLRGQNPIGKRFRFTYKPNLPYHEIVGVVADTADASLDSPAEPAVFLPFAQDANSYINYIVRTSNDPSGSIGAIRDALHQTDPQLAVILPLTMVDIISQSPSVFLRRYPSFLIGSFALLALILAAVGLYGLVSYAVAQRAREIGIRLALGAQRRDVFLLVIGEGARLAFIGAGAGLVAAIALAQLIRSILFGVKASDPLTFLAVALLLVVVAMVACYFPARRATKVDPVVALRHE